MTQIERAIALCETIRCPAVEKIVERVRQGDHSSELCYSILWVPGVPDADRHKLRTLWHAVGAADSVAHAEKLLYASEAKHAAALEVTP